MHDFQPVAGHPDDDECTHRADGTDDTYCGLPAHDHHPMAELRALSAAATPGPWWTHEDRPRYIRFPEGVTAEIDEADWGPEGHEGWQLVSTSDDRAWSYTDIRFVIAAVNHVRDLLAPATPEQGEGPAK